MGKKKKLDFSDLGGMVFSTDPDYKPDFEEEVEGRGRSASQIKM